MTVVLEMIDLETKSKMLDLPMLEPAEAHPIAIGRLVVDCVESKAIQLPDQLLELAREELGNKFWPDNLS